jgi:hypothetical protein
MQVHALLGRSLLFKVVIVGLTLETQARLALHQLRAGLHGSQVLSPTSHEVNPRNLNR